MAAQPESVATGPPGRSPIRRNHSHLSLPKEEKPPWVEGNAYLMSGYRPRLTFRGCLQSVFALHNETANIWSALFLATINPFMCWHALDGPLKDAHAGFRTWFILQFALRTLCWLNSFFMHTFNCHSAWVYWFVDRLDFAGIYLAVVGMGCNAVYLELYCLPAWRHAIMVLGCFSCALTLAFTFHPKFATEEYRSTRALVFFFNVVVFMAPILYWAFSRPDAGDYYHHVGLAFLYLAMAAFFFVTLFPERAVKEVFDIAMPSHSLWHWFCLGFDINWYWFCLEALQHLHDNGLDCNYFHPARETSDS